MNARPLVPHELAATRLLSSLNAPSAAVTDAIGEARQPDPVSHLVDRSRVQLEGGPPTTAAIGLARRISDRPDHIAATARRHGQRSQPSLGASIRLLHPRQLFSTFFMTP